MQKAIKRFFDIIFSLLALICLAPVWVVIGLWVAISSKGGIFFRQKRTGLHNQDFDMLKFRSMRPNAEADTVQAEDENDPRVTPVGKFLRKSSLDEIPQLFNVLRGDMSLIGPRPHMLAHTDYYSARIPSYMDRHRMRPGLTGYAQILGYRGGTPTIEDMQKRVDADNYYIEHYSLWFDIKIFTRTILKILTLNL